MYRENILISNVPFTKIKKEKPIIKNLNRKPCITVRSCTPFYLIDSSRRRRRRISEPIQLKDFRTDNECHIEFTLEINTLTPLVSFIYKKIS